MDIGLSLLAFWPALALGSFVNVVAARVPLRRSVVRPASACMSCGTELAWYDNVPVLSWLLLHGRCRSCSAKISPLYPAGMGMGDVKLALLLGAMLGRVVGVGLMLGMLAALLPSIVLLARHGSAARKMGIPFAPFLALGALIALFAGDALLDAYLSTF